MLGTISYLDRANFQGHRPAVRVLQKLLQILEIRLFPFTPEGSDHPGEVEGVGGVVGEAIVGGR